MFVGALCALAGVLTIALPGKSERNRNAIRAAIMTTILT